jgi:hypothetical protein
MSLESGCKLNCNHWTELPMPKEVIDQVHVLARCSKANKNLLFTDRNGNVPVLGQHIRNHEVDENNESNGNEEDSDDDDYLPEEDNDTEQGNDDEIEYEPEYDREESLGDNTELVHEAEVSNDPVIKDDEAAINDVEEKEVDEELMDEEPLVYDHDDKLEMEMYNKY